MRKRLAGVFAVAVVVAGACGSSTATAFPTGGSPAPSGAPAPTPSLAPAQLTGSTYAVTPAVTQGGSVVLAEWEQPDTVNPYLAMKQTDTELSASMFDGLLKVTPDLKYAPDLATKVPTLDNGGVVLVGNGMDVTWNLKPLMSWSDGQPINCDDIKATWQWIMDKDNAGLAGGTIGWQDVSGVDGGDGNVCVMHFSVVYEGYLNLVSPVFPAHYLATVPVKTAATKLYPLGDLASGVYSGPYIPGVRSAGQITLKPNPQWQSISGHAPWLKSVTWKYFGDVGKMIEAYKAGGIDVAQRLSETDLSILSTVDPSQLNMADYLTYELHEFNNDRLKTTFGADASTIVNAIKLATDRKAIVAELLSGSVTVANNYVSPYSWYYKTIDGSTDADLVTATTLLANAGWTKNADGFLSKGGKVLELTYCSPIRQIRLDTLKLVATQLKQIGIHVIVDMRPQANVFGLWDATKPDTACNLVHGNFDVAEFSRTSPFDPLGGYDAYYSSRTPDTAPHDGGNVARVSLPALDAAYDTVRSTVDFARVKAAMASVQSIYGSDRNTYELPLYFRKDIWLANPKLHNFTGNPMPFGAEWNIGDWWVG
jgi:peptide/nickel transport system substrate-binding protein